MPGVEFGAYAGYVELVVLTLVRVLFLTRPNSPKIPNGQRAYWGENLPRLQQLKARYDPHDVYHNPQSVLPVAS
jgi:hypothetical protein